jgi:prophage DNA circulation protein
MSEEADAVSGASTASRMADYTAVMKAMQAQWESMLQAIGGPVAAGMIPIMKGLTTEFNSLGAAAIAHGDDIHKVMDGIIEPLKGLATAIITAGPPIAKGAQELEGFLNAIISFENKLGATTHAFLKSWGIDFGGENGSKSYDPLSSIHTHPAMKTTPSGIALSGGADNAKLAAASAMPVNLPSVNVAAPSVDVKATTQVILDGASIIAAISTRIEKIVHAALASSGMGGTNSDSGFDGRAHPAYPDTMHGTH